MSVALANTSHFSTLSGLSKFPELIDAAHKQNIKGLAVTDFGLSGVVNFLKSLKEKKSSIKPIIGSVFHCDSNSYYIIAKNQQGWKKLVYASSLAQTGTEPLSLEKLAEIVRDHCICYAGGPESSFAQDIFGENRQEATTSLVLEHIRGLVNPHWDKNVEQRANYCRDLFGKDNFYLGIFYNDSVHYPVQIAVNKTLQVIGEKLHIPCLPLHASNYAEQEFAIDHRVLLATKYKTSSVKLEDTILKSDNYQDVRYLRSNSYYLRNVSDLATPEELSNLEDVYNVCEKYEIERQPIMPVFDCPDGLNSSEYLKKLCYNNFGKYAHKKEYADRLEYELGVFEKANLASYFLVVQDYANWARKQGWMVELRGSGAGCLTSFFLGITRVDAVKYKLWFERFYNVGRNSPGKISLPDIDLDVPVREREKIFAYIKQKYGEGHVGQICTYGKTKGREALKMVLRAYNACSFDEMNRVTKPIPDEASIADDLQEMKQDTGESSIIRWALENESKKLKEWCYLENNEFKGEGKYPFYFQQAIRLEKTIRQIGKHAAGIVICPEPLMEACPMIRSKSGDPMTAFAMEDVEYVGITKYDILGVAMMDRLQGAKGEINGEYQDD